MYLRFEGKFNGIEVASEGDWPGTWRNTLVFLGSGRQEQKRTLGFHADFSNNYDLI